LNNQRNLLIFFSYVYDLKKKGNLFYIIGQQLYEVSKYKTLNKLTYMFTIIFISFSIIYYLFTYIFPMTLMRLVNTKRN